MHMHMMTKEKTTQPIAIVSNVIAICGAVNIRQVFIMMITLYHVMLYYDDYTISCDASVP